MEWPALTAKQKRQFLFRRVMWVLSTPFLAVFAGALNHAPLRFYRDAFLIALGLAASILGIF
jgi:hypothetical protein